MHSLPVLSGRSCSVTWALLITATSARGYPALQGLGPFRATHLHVLFVWRPRGALAAVLWQCVSEQVPCGSRMRV